MAEPIKGALVASHIRHQVRRAAADPRTRGIHPCLAICIVGDDPAGRLYVRREQRACAAGAI
jgi:methylenetetrahydrofolate dehydrogenase (NADP+)/methenyltetrahydrofolate cyclohydrolase